MIIYIVLGSVLISSVTPSGELYACRYPGCSCEDLAVGFSLTCHVTTSSGMKIPRQNVSINIVSVTLKCNEGQTDPILLLDSVQRDLHHAQMLILEDCVTSLSAVFSSGRFQSLTRLSLHNATLADQDISDVMSKRPLLTALEVSHSDVRLQNFCSLTHLSRITLHHVEILSDPGCSTNTTLFSLRKLSVSHSDLKTFPSWVQMAPFLSELYLHFNQLSFIPAGILQYMADLTVLDLSSNDLTSLPSRLFSNQSGLKYLNLSTNQLTSLPSTLLQNTENLRSLDLSFNKIRYLSSGLFGNFRNLNILNLSSNSLSIMMRAHFTSLKSLTYLNLGNNSLRHIPDITPCQDLQVLDLRRNQIEYILRPSLRGLSRLEGISLRYNRLTNLPLETIAVSSKLTILDFSHNNISYIDYRSKVNMSNDLTVTDSLAVLSNVRILLLNSNRLTTTYRLNRVFSGLETLLLDDNQISHISSRDLPLSLQGISLSFNRISSIQRNMFVHFPKLKMVVLKNNYPYLATLPIAITTIDKHAKPKPEMYISGNLFLCDCEMAYFKTYHERDKHESFQYFSRYLPTFPDLEDVFCITEHDSTVRKLVQVPEEEFVCSHEDPLCEIGCNCCEDRKAKACPCLHSCPAQCRCSQGGSPWGVYSARTHCHNSSIIAVPQGIPSVTTYLHLENTSVTKLRKDEFSSLQHLKKLFLNASQISILSPGCFNGLRMLTHLYLNDNRLRQLSPSSWSGLCNLTHLCLQNNQIHSIEPETFTSLIQLQYLDLSNNRLTHISGDFLPDLPSTTAISISHNPLSCSCPDMHQTVSFLTVYGPNIVTAGNLTCYLPSNQTESADISLDAPFAERGNFTLPPTILIETFDIDDCGLNNTIFNETLYENRKYVEDNRHAVTLSVMCVLLAVTVVVAIVTYRKRSEIQAWLFVKYGVRLRSRTAGLDESGREYDAFVSYSSHDEHLVVHELAPRLEEGRGERHGKRHYHLCLHYRDFPVGDSIADTIIESIEASKRTIMLLSDNFLASEWCRYEFQTAHHHVLKERSHRLIIVLLHELDDQKLDPDLRVHLNEGNYLRYSDPWFWEKLYFALPDVPVDKNSVKRDEPNNIRKQSNIDNEWGNVFFKDGKL